MRLRTTEYVDGFVTFTGTNTFDVDLEVRIKTKKGAFLGECTGSAEGGLEWDGVWNCAIIGGTRRFKGAKGEGTVHVHGVTISSDLITHVSIIYISSVRAKGTVRF